MGMVSGFFLNFIENRVIFTSLRDDCDALKDHGMRKQSDKSNPGIVS
jgi:hypothetical protein